MLWFSTGLEIKILEQYLLCNPSLERRNSPCIFQVVVKQSNFQEVRQKMFGFEHFLSQIRHIEKNCLLIAINNKE
jgi:hypothetical protein